MPQQNISYDTTPFEHGDRLDFPSTPDHMVSSADFYANQREVDDATLQALAFASSRGGVSGHDTRPVASAENAVVSIEVQSAQYVALASAHLGRARREELNQAA